MTVAADGNSAMKKLKGAVFTLNNKKAPRPDGIRGGEYKQVFYYRPDLMLNAFNGRG